MLRTGAGAGFASTIQLTNPDLLRNPADKVDPDVVLRRQSLGIVRDRVVADVFTETIRIDNYTLHPERCTLTFRLDADFADIFEVRGVVRERRGREEPTVVDGRTRDVRLRRPGRSPPHDHAVLQRRAVGRARLPHRGAGR